MSIETCLILSTSNLGATLTLHLLLGLAEAVWTLLDKFGWLRFENYREETQPVLIFRNSLLPLAEKL